MRRLIVLAAALGTTGAALAACGGADVDELTDAVAGVEPAAGSNENAIEPENVYQGGEWIEIDGCCPAFVYRPDGAHPDGWTGNGDTLVIRYFELIGLADGEAACDAYVAWLESNESPRTPSCEIDEPVDGGSVVLGLEGVELDGGDLLLGGQVTVDSSGVRAVFSAIAVG